MTKLNIKWPWPFWVKGWWLSSCLKYVLSEHKSGGLLQGLWWPSMNQGWATTRSVVTKYESGVGNYKVCGDQVWVRGGQLQGLWWPSMSQGWATTRSVVTKYESGVGNNKVCGDQVWVRGGQLQGLWWLWIRGEQQQGLWWPSMSQGYIYDNAALCVCFKWHVCILNGAYEPSGCVMCPGFVLWTVCSMNTNCLFDCIKFFIHPIARTLWKVTTNIFVIKVHHVSK